MPRSHHYVLYFGTNRRGSNTQSSFTGDSCVLPTAKKKVSTGATATAKQHSLPADAPE